MRNLLRSAPLSRLAALVAAPLLALSLSGCEATEKALQATIDTYWTKAAEKAKLETELETQLKTGLDNALAGKKVLSLLLYDIYIHSVYDVDVNLGSKQPTVKTPTSSFWGTPGHLWYELGWSVTWAKGNGAQFQFTLDLRPAFPDHRVKIYDLNVAAKGTALIDLDVKTGKTSVEVFTESASVDCKAVAKGWFWTIDIKDKVQKEIKSMLDEKVIKKAIKKTFEL